MAPHSHWHIDYLRAGCDLVEIWFATEAACREHSWAKALARLPGAGVPRPGFGSADCHCETHLLFVGEVLDGDVIDRSHPPLTCAYDRDVKKGQARLPTLRPAVTERTSLCRAGN